MSGQQGSGAEPKPQPTVPVSLSGTITEKERILIGQALAALVETDGWRLFVEFLGRREVAIARASLYEEGTKSYWRGRVEELQEIVQGVRDLIADGQRQVARSKNVQGIVFGTRFGATDGPESQADESLFEPDPLP